MKFILEIKREEILKKINSGESLEIEFKKSKNDIPKDVWETYSAFANTDGGVIILGVSEIGDKLEITGVNNPEKLKKEFWDTINNPSKINRNILTDKDIDIIEIKDKSLIRIDVPRALFSIKPITCNENPYIGTYKRNHEGDYRCTKEEVNFLIRDASEGKTDGTPLENYTFEDIDLDTLKKYMNRYSIGKESHPWINLRPKEFLEKIGGIKKDRRTGNTWLTFAGLVMFGKMQSIKDYIPNFHLDYFDNSTLENERWVDRVTLDGSWGEGNIFNFFFAVINKLYMGLKVPFEILEDGYTRRENTLAHTALREAFVNTIVHADYKGEAALKIIKYSDRCEFFNPGLLRISKEELFKGGNSYPRNPVLMSMFQYINIGERAGSGFPKILAAAKEYNWKFPEIIENPKLDFVQVVIWDETLKKQDIEYERNRVFNLDIKNIIEIISKDGNTSSSKIQKTLNFSKAKTIRLLNEMIERKIIRREGVARNTVYSLEKESFHSETIE